MAHTHVNHFLLYLCQARGNSLHELYTILHDVVQKQNEIVNRKNKQTATGR